MLHATRRAGCNMVSVWVGGLVEVDNDVVPFEWAFYMPFSYVLLGIISEPRPPAPAPTGSGPSEVEVVVEPEITIVVGIFASRRRCENG